MSIGVLAGIRGTSAKKRFSRAHPEPTDYPRRKELTYADWLEVWKEVLSKEEYDKRCAAYKKICAAIRARSNK